MPSRLSKRLAILTAATALVMGLGTASAFAAVSVTPSTGLSATTPTKVTVEGSGLAASKKFKVGLCSTTPYGMLGIPACGATVEVTSDGSGAFTTELTISKTTANVHKNLMPPLNAGQPTNFTCAGTGEEEEDECEVTVTFHNGLFSEVVGTKAVSFE
jgi:Neocarzinostatin family